jgi:uncharacterized protein (DUF1499 family)
MNASSHAASKPARLWSVLATLSLAAGLGCAVAALLAGPAYRVQWLSLGAGLQTIRWAGTIAVAGAALALVAAVLVARAPARSSLPVAVAALAINLLVAGWPIYLYWQVQRLPHIHDVSTDTDDPPKFVAVVPLRKGARNPVDYKPDTAAAQKMGYPDIAPRVVVAAPEQAFERAERAARAMGWEIVAVAPQDLRIEATDTTFLFGFNDDVVIRITPHAQGSIVDVRSLPRVGGSSDFGVNAKRIRAFLAKLAASYRYAGCPSHRRWTQTFRRWHGRSVPAGIAKTPRTLNLHTPSMTTRMRDSPRLGHRLTCTTAPQQKSTAMDVDLVMGRYLQLRRELSNAYQAQSWNSERIDWLADQIAETEREIAASQSVDEHFGDADFGFIQ